MKPTRYTLLLSVFFQLVYMFRATACPSSGEITVSIRPWYFSRCMGRCLVRCCRPDSHPYAVVKVLCYKSEGCWFDPSWCQWNFFIDIKSFRSHYGLGIDSASNRNEHQEHFLGGKGSRCVRLTTLPPSCAVVMKSGNLNFLEPSGPVQACNGTALPFYKYIVT